MTTDQTSCPNCAHPHHLPGTECQTPVHHGPNRWHLCLCLARPGAALSCPPQMTCQGGTLGYADVWYLQHGHTLLGEDGEIAPAVFETGVASVGFPSGPDIAAAAVSSVGQAPATDRAAKAEALLLRFTAEAHRRKWSYDRGVDDDGVPIKSEAFEALHRLGEEMRVELEKLRAVPVPVLPAPTNEAAVPGRTTNETAPVTVHAIPLPGSNGISSCCGRPPCEFVGERLTRDPDKVTCPGPAVGGAQQPTEDRTFIPPAHYRRDDGVDCCVHTIPVGPDSCRECRELADT